MALSFFLTKRATFQRNTVTRGTAGGPVESWAAYATNVQCCMYAKKRQDASGDFDRRDWYGEYEVVTGASVGAQPGDRVLIDGAYYDIASVNDYGHDNISFDTPIVHKCYRRKVS